MDNSNYDIIKSDPVTINYIRNDNNYRILSKDRGLIFISCFIIGLSIIIYILQIFQWKPLVNVKTYMKIQKNVSNWSNLINEITSINSTKGKQLSLEMKNDIYNFSCYDYGAYYIPMRLNPSTYLPEAIRRGDGDGWVINKASLIDSSSHQFCLYVISKYPNNLISCGTDMFNKIKYSGYYETGHWCSTALNNMYNDYNIVNGK